MIFKDQFLGTLDNLTQRNRVLGFGLVLMLLFNVMNWFSLQRAISSSRVTLVPVTGGTGLWVGNGKASDEYIRSMARYITGQLGNYSAGTYRPQLEELLLLFPPDSVGQMHTEITRLADEVDRYPSISSYIQWLGSEPLKVQGDMLQVRTMKHRLVSGNETDHTQTYYCIQYRIDDTQFRLIRIEELPGSGEDLCIAARAAVSTSNPASTVPTSGSPK